MNKSAQVIVSALALLLLGVTVKASPDLATKSSKTHSTVSYTGYKIRRSAKYVAHLPAASAPHHKASVTSTSSTGAGPLRLSPEQMRDFSDGLRKSSDSFDLSTAGDAEAELKNWSHAAALYQDALNVWSQNSEALYGLGQCAAAAGDLPRAISYYRTAVYVPSPNTLNTYGTVPGDGFQTNDVTRLMEFALLLDRAGQTQEAVFIYNRAAALIDYERGDVQHGDPNLKVLLPALAMVPTQPNQVQYTQGHLQALADTALARQGFDYKQQRIHIQEAAKLYPDSPVIQYYLGETLSFSFYHTLEHPAQDKVAMTAAYKKAIELGDDKTVAAAKERLSMYP